MEDRRQALRNTAAAAQQRLLEWSGSLLPALRQPAYLAGMALLAGLGYAAFLAAPLAGLYALTTLPRLIADGLSGHGWNPALVDGAIAAAAVGFTVYLLRFQLRVDGTHPLSATETPALFTAIDALRKHQHSAAITGVMLNDTFAIDLVSLPRRALPVGRQSHLLLGLPLLMCLSPLHFRIALDRRLNRPRPLRAQLVRWLTQQRHVWTWYRASFRGHRDPLALTVRLWLLCYEPLFRRLVAGAARLDELDSDRELADHTSSEDIADTIAATVTGECFLRERFWPDVFRLAAMQADPPAPYQTLERALHQTFTRDDARDWLDEAMRAETDRWSMTPALEARLSNIGYRKIWPQRPPEVSAAREFLQPVLDAVLNEFDQQWQHRQHSEWPQRHSRHHQAREELTALRRKANNGALHGTEAMKYASLIKQYAEPSERVPALKALVATNPDDAQLQFGIGRMLLAQGEPDGILVLKQAARLDARFAGPAGQLIAKFATLTPRPVTAARPSATPQQVKQSA
jgi:hypothetical protein